MRSLLILPLFSIITSPLGCSLFASGAIDKTCDELPGCPDGVIDSASEDSAATDGGGTDGGSTDGGSTDGGTTDSGTTDGGSTDGGTTGGGTTGGGTTDGGTTDGGTTADTGLGEAISEVIFVGYDEVEGELSFWVYSPDGALIASLTTASPAPTEGYRVAWDGSSGVAYLAQGSQVLGLDLDRGSVVMNVAVREAVSGLALTDDAIWVVGQTGIGLIQQDKTGAHVYSDVVTPETFTELSGGYYHPLIDAIKVVDLDAGGPDLWSLDIESAVLTETLEDFDDQEARARIPFLGDSYEAWTCTSSGAVYDMKTLSTGDREPRRLLDKVLTDIVDCGYDSGSGEVVMFSQTAGALRVAADGSAEVIPIADGYTLLAGATW